MAKVLDPTRALFVGHVIDEPQKLVIMWTHFASYFGLIQDATLRVGGNIIKFLL